MKTYESPSGIPYNSYRLFFFGPSAMPPFQCFAAMRQNRLIVITGAMLGRAREAGHARHPEKRTQRVLRVIQKHMPTRTAK